MKVQVLGSAAGGGFPQWNCNCTMCAGYRAGNIKAEARTQSSIAISENGVDWILFNTSPDIRQQLASFAPMQPNRTLRDTGIAHIIFMDSQIDHTTGLLMLREGCPHNIWCTDAVRQDLTENFPIFAMLKHWNGGNNYNSIPVNDYQPSTFTLPGIENLEFTAIPLLSNAPPYSPRRDKPAPGDNIGISVTDKRTGKTVFYAPGLGEMQDHLIPLMAQADLLLVDGTLWSNDEMQQRGVGTRLGSQMGHLPQSGPGGMIELLSAFDRPRKVLIHINNTNPILDENSNERATLKEHQIEVAFDGMSFEV